MGLYLAVFDDGDELDGVEIGSYEDFSTLRHAIVTNLEAGIAGARFPTLILHSDCDGVWTPAEAAALEQELETISKELSALPPIALKTGWQPEVAKVFNIRRRTLYDCFFDVDGEPLLERLLGLARLSKGKGCPIMFQ